MEEMNPTDFNGPIPGESLTHEFGSSPDERPPEITDPAEAYESVVNRISSPEVFERISVASELGIPVELTVRAMVFAGWAGGKYSIDTMYLIYGPVFEITMAMLDSKGIDYLPLAKRKEDESLEKAYDVLAQIKGLDKAPEESVDEPEETEEPSGGLMRRPE